ncbi:M3 family metallopeptidase [candidate division KSB1 bacterium]
MKAKILISAGLLMFACSYSPSGSGNPFFSEFDTPFGVPPFDDIREDHYMRAFTEGMKQQKEEVAAITGAVDGPTFENTIETLELSGKLLTNVSNVFYNMVSANTNDRLQDIAKEVAPLLSKHSDDILLDADLFKRVKAVYDMKDDIGLTVEQEKLLDETYKGFVRGGANLDTEDQKKLRKINEELSLLTVRFGENVLKEDNNFKLVIDREEDLAGLPGSVIAGAAEAARESGEEGKWVFTLHKPSMIPFLQYSGRRELREKIFRAYINRGNNDNEFDNKNIVSQIASLRVQKAGLLGYGSHAGYVLEENMAKTPENVYDLLNRLWKPALEMAKREADELQSMIDEEGKGFELQAWDWWYYAEKMRMEKYDLDEEALRPYFKLENVRDGAFMIANRLYGVTFEEMTDIPKYLDEVKTFEVKDADGSHLGIFYVDYFPRSSKRGGAWMNSFRKQSRPEGKEIHPVICNVCNFSKPAGDKPALLSFEEVRTLFHEFGHALHGLLANTTYNSLSGTSVPRDFVELPSQIMENWAAETEVLSTFAKHYETGETIPQELIDKINNSRQFNQGFATVEYLAASFLDMDWHTLTGEGEQDVLEFETNSLRKIGLMPEIVVRYRSPYFNHIFSGGYASGYYSYIWAEVLDADAFEVFKENGLFDAATALAFRKNILERGGTEDPMTLYKRFRGSEPQIDALLKRRGLK